MANEKHIYLTLQGDYDHASLASEQWQVGIRFVMNFGTTDYIDTLPNNWEPTAITVSRTETDWRIDGNWHVEGPALATFAADDWLNDQVAPAVDDWMNQGSINNIVRVRSAKCYPIGTDGQAIPAPPYAVGSPVTLTWTSGFPVGAGGSTALAPLQNSVVCSHRTGQLGRRGRGRMFLPGLQSSQFTRGRLTSGVTADILAKQQAFLAALSIVGGGGAQMLPIITGAPWKDYAVITTVSVGDVVDTQRRRRNQLVEARVDGGVTY